MSTRPYDLLLVIDVARTFPPLCRLAVADGDDVVPVVNRLARRLRSMWC